MTRRRHGWPCLREQRHRLSMVRDAAHHGARVIVVIVIVVCIFERWKLPRQRIGVPYLEGLSKLRDAGGPLVKVSLESAIEDEL